MIAIKMSLFIKIGQLIYNNTTDGGGIILTVSSTLCDINIFDWL